jgi:hypothetical protein
MVAPSDTGTYYIRISNFAASDGSGTSIDESAIAFSLNNAINLSAFVPPRLEFCVATTISGFSCATAQGSLLNFGEFSTGEASTQTAQMVIATNSVTGFTIAMIGTTLTSGNNVIPASATAQTSLAGTSRFGVNLRDNSGPNVGSNVQGPGTGVALAPYNTPDQFAFASGDSIARSVFSTDYNKFTMSYVATIGEGQPPGVYTTTMTYIATATF